LPENNANISISIILPVFNEERIIEESINRLVSYCNGKRWDFELIFVEDGCTDSTYSIVNRYSLKDGRIRMLKLPTRVGKGGSIICTVLQFPLKEYVAYMDSDLAADPSELERLFEYIKHFDVVLGSRILRGDLPPVQRPFYRSLFSHLYSRLFRTLFRIPIHDPQCGLKLFRREITSKLFSDVRVLGFAFDTDLIVKALSQGLRVKEVPINWSHGKFSTVCVFDEIKSMGLDLLSIWYSSHLLWKQNKTVYPQKQGSICGRLLFALLSLSSKIKKRPLKYPRIESIMSNLTEADTRNS
jgi:glycosyltransferase involved in cell wall biosynthesis